MKKLFALLFVVGLLTLAVGCPPATTGGTGHGGTTPPKGFSPPGPPSGMPGMTGMGTGAHTGAEKTTEKAGPGGTEKTTEKAGPGGAEKTTEKSTKK